MQISAPDRKFEYFFNLFNYSIGCHVFGNALSTALL